MSDNPKHAKPWTEERETLDWLRELSNLTTRPGQHRKQATK